MRATFLAAITMLSVFFIPNASYSQSFKADFAWGKSFSGTSRFNDILSICISNSGKYAAAGSNGSIKMWNAETGSFLRSFNDWPPMYWLDMNVAGVAFDYTEQVLLCCYGNDIALWGIMEEYPRKVVSVELGFCTSIIKTFRNAPMALLTGLYCHRILVLNYETEQTFARIDLLNDSVIDALLFDNDTKIACGTNYGYVIIYDALTGEQLKKWRAYEDYGINSLTVSSDNTLLYTVPQGGGAISAWNLADTTEVRQYSTEDYDLVRQVSQNTLLVTDAASTNLYLLDTETNQNICVWNTGSSIERMDISSMGNFVFKKGTNVLYLKSITEPTMDILLSKPGFILIKSLLSADNSTCCIQYGQGIYHNGIKPVGFIVYDYSNGNLLCDRVFTTEITHIALSRDGIYTAVCSNNSIYIYDNYQNKLVHTVENTGECIADFTPLDNNLAIARASTLIDIYDWTQRILLTQYPRSIYKTTLPDDITFSYGGEKLAITTDGTIEVISTNPPIAHNIFSGDDLIFPTDTSRILLTYNGKIRVWNTSTYSNTTESAKLYKFSALVNNENNIVGFRYLDSDWDGKWDITDKRNLVAVIDSVRPTFRGLRHAVGAMDGASCMVITDDNSVLRYDLSFDIVGIDHPAAHSSATHLTVHNPYPNPANNSTALTYSLANNGFVSIEIYDLLGRRVTKVFEGFQAPGGYSVNLDCSMLTPGSYNCVIRSGRESVIKPLVVR